MTAIPSGEAEFIEFEIGQLGRQKQMFNKKGFILFEKVRRSVDPTQCLEIEFLIKDRQFDNFFSKYCIKRSRSDSPFSKVVHTRNRIEIEVSDWFEGKVTRFDTTLSDSQGVFASRVDFLRAYKDLVKGPTGKMCTSYGMAEVYKNVNLIEKAREK